MPDAVLTPREIAARYRVDVHTVLAWIARGELRAVNVSRSPRQRRPRWRVMPEALSAWEVGRRTAAPLPRARRRMRSADIEDRY